ncbi:glucuronosyltransferase [candidate division GN15 bacterium]|nr:glucuronosyltransferase [candidate division GN15 bacterium]
MKRVVLITGHYWGSKRWAGFHWIADAFARRGWHVTFFTASISHLSRLIRDYRFQYPIRAEAGKVYEVRDNIDSFVWFTPWHPANLRSHILNRFSMPLFATYGDFHLNEGQEALEEADLLVFESTPGLLLYRRSRQLNPKATCIYRVSDDLRLLKSHPAVIREEERIVENFDLVSVPSRYIYDKFRTLPNVRLQHHGIRKELFDGEVDNPYDCTDVPNAVFVGSARLDVDFLRRAARLFPDWQFHIIGPIEAVPEAANIHRYGELRHEETIPYIVHADIGLHTMQYSPGAESFTDSLKVIQYAYCRLPIVTPEFLKSGRSNKFYYRPGDDSSIETALREAAGFDRQSIDTSQIRSWGDLVDEFIAVATNP